MPRKKKFSIESEAQKLTPEVWEALKRAALTESGIAAQRAREMVLELGARATPDAVIDLKFCEITQDDAGRIVAVGDRVEPDTNSEQKPEGR